MPDQLHSPIQGLLPHGLGEFLPGTALAMAPAVLFGCWPTGPELFGAVLTGLAAGIAAVLISSALRILADHGMVRALTRPELWAAIVMAVAAQVGAQQAFSRGAPTWSLPR